MIHYIQPDKPDQNADIERFNRTYRTEVLNAHLFDSTAELQALTDTWLRIYNRERPHDSLGRKPPLTFAEAIISGAISEWTVCLTGKLTDQPRRTRQAESTYPTYDAPVFETSFKKRRLRLLNSLLRALDRVNVSVSIGGRVTRTLVAHVGDFSVGFTIDGVSVTTASTEPKCERPMGCQLGGPTGRSGYRCFAFARMAQHELG